MPMDDKIICEMRIIAIVIETIFLLGLAGSQTRSIYDGWINQVYESARPNRNTVLYADASHT